MGDVPDDVLDLLRQRVAWMSVGVGGASTDLLTRLHDSLQSLLMCGGAAAEPKCSGGLSMGDGGRSAAGWF